MAPTRCHSWKVEIWWKKIWENNSYFCKVKIYLLPHLENLGFLISQHLNFFICYYPFSTVIDKSFKSSIRPFLSSISWRKSVGYLLKRGESEQVMHCVSGFGVKQALHKQCLGFALHAIIYCFDFQQCTTAVPFRLFKEDKKDSSQNTWIGLPTSKSDEKVKSWYTHHEEPQY